MIRHQLVIAAAQVTEIVMPEVGGTDAEQAAIWQILSRYKHVFGPGGFFMKDVV